MGSDNKLQSSRIKELNANQIIYSMVSFTALLAPKQINKWNERICTKVERDRERKAMVQVQL